MGCRITYLGEPKNIFKEGNHVNVFVIFENPGGKDWTDKKIFRLAPGLEGLMDYPGLNKVGTKQ